MAKVTKSLDRSITPMKPREQGSISDPRIDDRPFFQRIFPAWLRDSWGATGIVMAAYVLLFVLWTAFHWGGEEYAATISDLAYLPVSLFAAVCAWRITASRQQSMRMRLAWLALGMGIICSFLGDLVWFYYEIILKQAPFPSLADVFYLANYPLILLGLVMLPAFSLTRTGRVKFLLDMAIAIVAAWVPVWFFLLSPTMAVMEGNMRSQLIASAYPVGDLILITGIVSILLRLPEPSVRKGLYLILGGVAFMLSGDLIFSSQSLDGTYLSGSWVDVTWITGYLLWAWAALATRRSEADDQIEPRTQGFLDRASSLLPYISSALGFGFLILVTALSFQQAQPKEGLLIGASLLTGLVLARQLVELRENQRLNTEVLQASKEMQRLYQNAEQKAAEREKEIKLAAKVGQRLSRLSDLDSLLNDAVDLIRERFELYHTQVYLVDQSGRNLVLRASTGQIGKELIRRGHRLAINATSINGTAAVEKRNVIVDDTSSSLIFRSNYSLPETRSEMAVPLIVGEEVLGVLDIQSCEVGVFTPERLPAFEAIAERLAMAIENARLLAETEHAREQVADQARRLARMGWQDYLDAIESSENIAYTYDPQSESPLSVWETSPGIQHTLAAPIVVSGEAVGRFVFEGRGAWNEDDQALVDTVARLAAQQVENLRLLAQAERYRIKAEDAVLRLTRQGWEVYLQDNSTPEIGYMYDQNTVTTWTQAQESAQKPAVSALLKAGEQGIGELAVLSVAELDEDKTELLTAVAGQLSAHLENLRLFESAQQELIERRRAEETLLKFRHALERSTDAIFMTDTQGVIIYVNAAFEKVYGYTSTEAVGKTPRILKSGVIPQEGYQEFWQTLLNKQTVAGEIINKSKDGKLIPVEGANTPVLDNDGNLVGFLAVHRDITERKQAQEALSKRASELETVAKLSATVTALSEPAQIMQSVVDLAKDAFGLYHAHIYRLDEAQETLVLAAGSGEVGRQMVEQGWMIPVEREQSLVARAARTRQGVVINDVRDEPGFLPNPLLPETRAEMAIPILVADQVLGVLDVQSDQAERFTQEDINIQTTLAAQVAVALENAHLLQRTQTALAETETLYAISTATSRSLELEEVLGETLDHLLQALDYEAGLVSMVDEVSGGLYLAVHRNIPESMIQMVNACKMEGTLCEMVYQQQSPICIENLNEADPMAFSDLTRLGLHSYLGTPILSKGTSLGTICLFGLRPHPGEQTNQTLVQAAAQQVSIAIENTRLYKQSQRQAAYEAAVNTISHQIQTTTTVESAMQVAIRELGRALGAQRTTIRLHANAEAGLQANTAEQSRLPGNGASVRSPSSERSNVTRPSGNGSGEPSRSSGKGTA